MDKGFNDDELADIMNEIESLEKEFTEEVDSAPVEDPIAEEMNAQLEESEDVVVAEVEEPVAEVEEAVAEVEEAVAEVEEAVAEVEEAVVDTSVEEMVAETMPVEAVEEEISQSDVEVDHEMEEVLSELSDMPVEEVVAKHDAHDDNVHQLAPSHPKQEVSAPATTGGHSSMSFNVEGDMKLDLAFNVSGKVVKLNISENGFELELDGGVKFSIPLDDAQANKKAA